MTDLEKATTTDIRHSSFGINSSSVIRHSSLQSAFTLIELIVVFGIILVLSGLILSTAGYARKKAARTRAETEIAAMSAAIENYKADKGVYPTDATATDSLDSTAAINFTNYQTASQYMYGELAGDPDFDGVPTLKAYMQFKPNMLGTDANNKVYPRDPFGNSYGYSTRMATTGSGGYNPTFDLWSTTGITSGSDSTQWIKNW